MALLFPLVLLILPVGPQDLHDSSTPSPLPLRFPTTFLFLRKACDLFCGLSLWEDGLGQELRYTIVKLFLELSNDL